MKQEKRNKTMVAYLRKLGFKVDVLHNIAPFEFTLPSGKVRRAIGCTTVTLESPVTKKVYVAESICVEKNYSKKDGIEASLDKIFDMAQEHEHQFNDWSKD